MADIDLDKLIAQRAEARGDDGDRVSFSFKGGVYTFRDPQLLSDADKDELADLKFDVDIAAWYMGDDQYDEFCAAGGNSSLFLSFVMPKHLESVRDQVNGTPTRPNRSSRRAASKSPKQR